MVSGYYPVKLIAPDISAYKAGNIGIDYVTTFDSGKAGPHVMVSAVTHGNELCGAITLDFLFRHKIQPTRGKLTYVFNNYRAFLNFNPKSPLLSRFIDEDFNRLWSGEVLDGQRESAELERARELRPLINDIDLLLDIHSMQTSIEPLMLAGPLEKGRVFAQSIGYPAYGILDKGHASGRRLRDYKTFADTTSGRNALLVECGQHWDQASAEVALQTTLRFLHVCGAINFDVVEEYIVPSYCLQKIIEVTDVITVNNNNFEFIQPYSGLEVISTAGTIFGVDGDVALRTPYNNCVLVMPSRYLHPGQTAVRLGRYI